MQSQGPKAWTASNRSPLVPSPRCIFVAFVVVQHQTGLSPAQSPVAVLAAKQILVLKVRMLPPQEPPAGETSKNRPVTGYTCCISTAPNASQLWEGPKSTP
jgi:hypothetical protein